MEIIEIEQRKPVWLAISEFYLDTELERNDISRIREIFKKSGYSLNELKDIDFYEVRPIVGLNLSSTAGSWAGFDENWLWNQVQAKTLKRKRKKGFLTSWKRRRFESNQFSYWNKFESDFRELVEV